jgi:(p)ppGpp synthase/HD superfamily hydrolase
MTHAQRYNKKLLVLRSMLIGAGYSNALIAMEFGRKLHCGTRKDGITHEFQHQVEIALYALTLPITCPLFREALICVIFLHDCREDFDITDAEIRALFLDAVFAAMVAKGVDAMTKKFRGIELPADQVFAEIAADELASIAKGCDRIHNLQTMVGVFGIEKQKSYIGEVKSRFLPMLKLARRSFPRHVMAYENIKHVMLSQIELVEAMHSAIETA